MKYDARMIRYSLVEFGGSKQLWTALELDDNTIPDGMRRYDLENRSQTKEMLEMIRGSAAPETRHSTLLCNEALLSVRTFPVKLQKKEHPIFIGEECTLQQYAAQNGLTLLPPKQEPKILPIQHIEHKSLLYNSSNEDLDRACVGHLRGDFGHGREFWTTWWPHHGQENVTDQFKQELDDMVNDLRENGMLRDRNTMYEFTQHMAGGKLGNDNRGEFGYQTKSEHYSYFIRCDPSPGAYNFYLYIYDRSLLEPVLEQQQEPKQEIGPVMG